MMSSTVAFNSAGGVGGGGVLTGFDQITQVTSSILANNLAAGASLDITLGPNGELHGAHNLTGTGADELADTIHGDPRLGPLQDNGGPTRTHALSSTSAALGAGSNPAAAATDQRGVPHARVIGGAVDIGAFELDTADTIFSDGFE